MSRAMPSFAEPSITRIFWTASEAAMRLRRYSSSWRIAFSCSAEPLHLDVSAQLAVRREQHHVEGLDATLLLHAALEADRLVEHLEASLLAAWMCRPRR